MRPIACLLALVPYGDQAPRGKIKLEFNAVHSNHFRVTRKDQGVVKKCRAVQTLAVQKVSHLFRFRLDMTMVCVASNG